ncbi:hypothetical protein TA3x_000132 [Tundrisphaera sp. TA3]|uniref:hypothetical protein n=1 Tax=Tundrisphaera sp. TA3 TaxID=3435775 RepID=UPI003EBC59E7
MNHFPMTCDATPGHPDPAATDAAPDAEMDIYLRVLPDGHLVFFAEPSRHGDEQVPSAAPGRGLRAWLNRTYHRFKDAAERSESGVGLQARRLFEWLRHFVSPDESMLRRLRRAEEIRIHHPPAMGPDEARSAWEAYLAGRRYPHLFWLMVDLVVSALTIPLAVIPGPNVLGYWFVYRAACHTLALLGIRRARRQAASTSFQAK